MSNNLIKTWLKLAFENPWLSGKAGELRDDPFMLLDYSLDENSFYECKTLEELKEKFLHGNWGIRTAFYYKNICFINQVNAGDEWLTMRNDIAFESFSMIPIIESGEFEATIDRILKATPEQLKSLDY